MATSNSNGLPLTKAIDPKAIAIFLNYQLQSQGITARVALKQNCLQILLEANQVPSQQDSVKWVSQALGYLKLSVTQSIKIYGRIKGKQVPSWGQQLISQSDLPHKSLSHKSGTASNATEFASPPKDPTKFNRSFPQTRNFVLGTHRKAANRLTRGAVVLLVPLGFLLMWGYKNQENYIPFLAAPVPHLHLIAARVNSPSPASTISQSSIFQAAIHKASQASTRTQTAKDREDWQQVSTLWQDAIVWLERIIPGDEKYTIAQQKIIEYQNNLIYAQQQFQAIPKPTRLGITQQSIQSLFANEKTGFRFKSATAIDGQARSIGHSPNGFALLELLGPASDLTKVTIVTGLPSNDANTSALNRTYMLTLLQHLMPDWNAADWLTQSITQLSDGYTGDLITIRNDKRIKLSAIGGVGTVVLVIEPN